MTEHEKSPRTTRNDNEGGRKFGHVHVPSQTQEASQNRGLADDSMWDVTRRQAPPGRQEVSPMNRRGSGTQQSRPPGKPAQDRRQHKRAA